MIRLLLRQPGAGSSRVCFSKDIKVPLKVRKTLSSGDTSSSNNEGHDASIKRVTMPAQLTMPAWQEPTPAWRGRVNAAGECEYNYLRLLLYANWQCIWTAYQCAQTLCICLRWMGKAVWVACQPQPWHNGIILKPQPQVTQNRKSEPISVGKTV